MVHLCMSIPMVHNSWEYINQVCMRVPMAHSSREYIHLGGSCKLRVELGEWHIS